MSQDKAATFGAMVRASLGGPPVAGVMAAHDGGSFQIPLGRAALVASDIGGRELVTDGVEWLIGDSAGSPILSRVNVIATSETRGKVLSGNALPSTSMMAEGQTAGLGRGLVFPTVPAPVAGDLWRFTGDVTGIAAQDEDGSAITTAAADTTFRYTGAAWQRQAAVFGEHEYNLDSVLEAKTEISGMLSVQAGDDFAFDSVLEAHRQSIADTLLVQSIAGGGTGNDLLGVVNQTGVQPAAYAMADRGASGALQTAEDAVEDAGGRGAYMSWGMGRDVSASARRALLEPGSDRRVEERGRLSLSGLPVQRIVEGLTSTTAVVADWRAVVQPISSDLAVVVDRVSNPGDIRVTSRLACANPILTHPQTCYVLAQA